MTDIDLIMSYDQNELEAVLEGLMIRTVDRQEMLAGLAVNIRVANNKKKLKMNDLFNRRKAINRIKSIFKGDKQKDMSAGLAERIKLANEHFKNK